MGKSTSWFQPVESNTQKTYAGVCTSMVLFVLGLASKEFENYPQEVTSAQKSAAEAFRETLDSTDTQEKQDALQKLLYKLFTQERGDLNRYDLTVYRFLILYSFREDGSLQRSGVITQFISAIVFFGRGAIFNKVLEVMKKTKHGFFKYVI